MNLEHKILNKIKRPHEIKRILKNRKNKKSIMCHGNFDLVHPGHIRHLMYAKSKADILIASCTADIQIKKKKVIPVIPERLRANNLASLEMVDFVVIDNNETPLKNISIIKPDYFIKGYEYQSKKNPNTVNEIKAVKNYGGKVIFSPGDIIFSSSNLKENINLSLPLERVRDIMSSEKFNFNDIIRIIHDFKKINVHVIGDTIIDAYHECLLLGQTNKTPTFSVKKINTQKFIGGAALVAKHLKYLGANVEFTSVLGKDDNAKFVLKELKKSKIKLNIIFDELRRTTFKERYWHNNYKMLQVDDLDNNIITDDKVFEIATYLKKKTDLFVFSDFRHGIFNSSTINIFQDKMFKKAIKVADSQVSNRWGNILDFKKFDILYPNEKEARFSTGDQDSPLRPLGQKLLRQSKAKNIILKLSERGAMCFKKRGFKPKEFFSVDSFAQSVKDGVGSGDALLSSSSLAYVLTKNIALSLIIGNFSAAIACSKKGNFPITKIELIDFIKKIETYSN